LNKSAIHIEEIEATQTYKLSAFTPPSKELALAAESREQLPAVFRKKVVPKQITGSVSRKEQANMRLLEEQCGRLCLNLFASGHDSIRSLGFTSSIAGEGKSFLATLTARILARHSIAPVTLVECNWIHPTLHETFGIPATPGLAEWLNGMCGKDDVRYEAGENLTVIPAGYGDDDAVKLLKRIQQDGLTKIFGPNELLVFDLPPIITSSYGYLASSLVEAVIMVVRGEVTLAPVLAEACGQLKDLSLRGLLFNQGTSRIPRWLRQLL
jgi:Mrp family chromosome partitioning ATPase